MPSQPGALCQWQGLAKSRNAFSAVGESFGDEERKTDGCQAGNQRAPGRGCGNKEEIVAEVWEE